jgi:hypothetical protein
MPSDLVHNERMKYLATLTNTVAAAALAAGVIAPLVAFSYGVTGPISGAIATAISLGWLAVGAILHVAVRAILGRLRG